MAERALLRLLLLLSERESGVGSEKECSVAGKVKARQEGTGQAGAAARRAFEGSRWWTRGGVNSLF